MSIMLLKIAKGSGRGSREQRTRATNITLFTFYLFLNLSIIVDIQYYSVLISFRHTAQCLDNHVLLSSLKVRIRKVSESLSSVPKMENKDC